MNVCSRISCLPMGRCSVMQSPSRHISLESTLLVQCRKLRHEANKHNTKNSFGVEFKVFQIISKLMHSIIFLSSYSAVHSIVSGVKLARTSTTTRTFHVSLANVAARITISCIHRPMLSRLSLPRFVHRLNIAVKSARHARVHTFPSRCGRRSKRA